MGLFWTGPCLELMDGGDMASYFDFFFQSQPICDTHWGFTDDAAREDFIDWCREEGCLPTMEETQEGEDAAAKKLRKVNAALEIIFDRSAISTAATDTDDGDAAAMAAEDEEYDRRDAETVAAAAAAELRKTKSMELQRLKTSEKKAATAHTVDAKRQQQMRQSLEDLRLKLEAPGLDDAQKKRLLAKAKKIAAQ